MAAEHTQYAARHENPKGPGDQRPTALEIIKDNDLIGKLEGKVALVTGVSSGIGIETAKALKATGAYVIGAVRNLEKGQQALKDDLEPGKLELIHLDMESLDSVRAAAKAFLAKSDKLHIVVNNAGIMATPEGRTKDGFELQFGVCHLAHFLLFNLLKDTIIASATPEFGARIINTSSTGHRHGPVQFDNLNFEGNYHPFLAYGQAKTANIYMASEIERRYGAKNVHAFAVHPGGIWTGLQAFVPPEHMEAWKKIDAVNDAMKSPEQGAATQIWAAVAKEWEGKGGLYLEECQASGPAKEGFTELDPGYVPHAFDEEKEKKLWKVSLELVGLEDDQ